MEHNCPLCGTTRTSRIIFSKPEERDYYHCEICDLRFLNPSLHLSPAAEKSRYLHHENDVNNEGYQNFVRPLVDAIRERANRNQVGLDYGAGSGPVSTELLRREGYTIELYDPYFWPNPDSLMRKYDFIFACEVIEHFYHPGVEFEKLWSMLNDHGFIAAMTSLYHPSIDFERWHYRLDPTHVVFYSEKTIQWIQNRFSFKNAFVIDQKVVILSLV